MSTIEDGGPAFSACAFVENKSSGNLAWQEGMSLRDYFAAKAMQAITEVSSDGIDDKRFEISVAIQSYMIADAMLEARKANPQK